MSQRVRRPWQSAVLVLLTAAIFCIDAFTRLDTAIAVMYVVVILMAASVWPRHWMFMLGFTCMLLTFSAYFFAHGLTLHPSPAGRMLVSIAAIGITAWLALQRQRGIDMLRERQDALRRSQAFLAGAQRLTHTGSFGIKVPDGAMTWSDEATRIFGYQAHVVPGIDPILARTHADDRTAVRAAWNRALRLEGAIDFEHRLLFEDGTLRHVHVLAEASHDADGNCEYLGAITDITERVQAEHDLHASHVQLAHAARVSMLGEMAASVAHEVNQPLTAIAANAQAGKRWLARAEPDIDEALYSFDGIIQASTRAGQVIGRIRALARRAEPEHVPINVNALIQETLELLQREFDRSGFTLHADLAPALPQVHGNRVELQQVLINLVMNAFQAADAARMAPDARRLDLRSAVENGRVCVSVRDYGPGIAASDCDTLFTPFFSTKEEGMGLGLSICRSIISQHGGQIVAHPAAPGSTFSFDLPTVTENQVHEPAHLA
jgi:two-component system sensor kinase FixL